MGRSSSFPPGWDHRPGRWKPSVNGRNATLTTRCFSYEGVGCRRLISGLIRGSFSGTGGTANLERMGCTAHKGTLRKQTSLSVVLNLLRVVHGRLRELGGTRSWGRSSGLRGGGLRGRGSRSRLRGSRSSSEPRYNECLRGERRMARSRQHGYKDSARKALQRDPFLKRADFWNSPIMCRNEQRVTKGNYIYRADAPCSSSPEATHDAST